MGSLFPDEKSENPNGVEQLHHQNDVDAGALFVLKSEGFVLYYVLLKTLLRLLCFVFCGKLFTTIGFFSLLLS